MLEVKRERERERERERAFIKNENEDCISNCVLVYGW
jgi:hypothetical protein